MHPSTLDRAAQASVTRTRHSVIPVRQSGACGAGVERSAGGPSVAVAATPARHGAHTPRVVAHGTCIARFFGLVHYPDVGLATLLVPLVGVGMIVLICCLAGGLRTAQIASEDAARARVHQDEPDFDAARVLLGRDRRAALLADHSGEDIAAVMSFGDKLVTRRLGRGAVRAVTVREQAGGEVLSIVISDPTCKRIDVALAHAAGEPGDHDASELGFWLAAVERLAAPAEGAAAPGGQRALRAQEA